MFASREQISQLTQNISTSLQASPAPWGALQTEIYGIQTNLATAEVRRNEQWSAIQTSLDQTTATCDETRAGLDEQLQEIQAVATMLKRAETRVDQQYTENKKIPLIFDAVQSLVAMMAARDEQPDSVSRKQDQADDGRRQDSTHPQQPLANVQARITGDGP